MSIGKQISKQLGNLVVNKPAFNNMGDTVNTLRNLDFDKSKFIVRQFGNQFNVSIRDISGDTAEPFECHFQCLANTASNTTVDVHCGSWIRFDGYDLTGDMTHIYMESTDGSGFSGKYENVYALTGFVEGLNNYIVLKMDDPFAPTICTPTILPNYPNSSMFDFSERVLAQVNVSSGVISSVEQFWTGGDITDVWEYKVDECSIELHPYIDYAGKEYSIQLHEFSNNSTTALTNISAADRIVKVQNSTGCIGYTLWSNCVADVISQIIFPPLSCTDVQACIDGYVNCSYINALGCGYLTALSHYELGDINTGNCGDHHCYGFPGPGSTNFSYIANTGDYARNNMTSGLGDSVGGASVNVNGRTLLLAAGSVATIDWGNYLLIQGGVTKLNWSTNTLTGGDWFASNNFSVTKTCFADEFELIDAVDCYWNHDIFYSSTDTLAVLEAPSATIRAGPMTCSIECNSAGPDINFNSSGGELNIDGSECLSTAGYAVIDPATGDVHDATWLHGFLTVVA